jgi:hypothetical protein
LKIELWTARLVLSDTSTAPPLPEIDPRALHFVNTVDEIITSEALEKIAPPLSFEAQRMKSESSKMAVDPSGASG